MSNCPGVHCPGCGGKTGAVIALAGLGATAWLVFEFWWVIAVALGLTMAGAVAIGAWMARYGGDVATVSRGALPAPEAVPIPSRRTEAIEGPQTVNFNFFGELTREQLDEISTYRRTQ